jgi:enamine deaminase RidA (YjgF/YER057c/UK114 family)
LRSIYLQSKEISLQSQWRSLILISKETSLESRGIRGAAMSEIQRINPKGLADSSHYGYAQITVVPADTKLAYIAGQLGEDENGNFPQDFEGQLKQAFANLRTALEAVGATPKQVVKITVLSVDHDSEKQRLISAERNAMWQGDHKSASTLIPVPRLAVDGALFEIDAIVAIPNS